jgi:hypothetical protein
MTMSNSQRVGEALTVLSKGLAPYIERELRSAYGGGWAAQVAQELGLPTTQAKKVSLDDVQFQLKVMWKLWHQVFGKVLGQSERTLVSELMDARNDWAHQKAFSTDDAYRVLDSAQRLLTAVSAEEAEQLEESKQELLRIRYEEYSRRKSKRTAEALFETPAPAPPPPPPPPQRRHHRLRARGPALRSGRQLPVHHRAVHPAGVSHHAGPGRRRRRLGGQHLHALVQRHADEYDRRPGRGRAHLPADRGRRGRQQSRRHEGQHGHGDLS